MDDIPHHTALPDWNPPTPSEAALMVALDESEAEAEAGLFVSGDEIMRELHDSIARMEGSGVAADHADVKPGGLQRR